MTCLVKVFGNRLVFVFSELTCRREIQDVGPCRLLNSTDVEKYYDASKRRHCFYRSTLRGRLKIFMDSALGTYNFKFRCEVNFCVIFRLEILVFC